MFQLGQWLKGRIYERRSDLSPDGKYLIYFAMNGKRLSETRGSWTAISRAPFLKALVLFRKGDCSHGGGLWTGTRDYWLNDGDGHTVLRGTSDVRRDTQWRPAENYAGERLGIYYPRLIRDGWNMKATVLLGKWNVKVIFEKPCPGGWVLRKIAHAGCWARPGRSSYWDEHEIVQPSSEVSIACPRWEWAELDGDRLVWAAGGRLEAGRLSSQGLVDKRTLFDFNAMTFTAIEAPY